MTTVVTKKKRRFELINIKPKLLRKSSACSAETTTDAACELLIYSVVVSQTKTFHTRA
jgi:hypothetical protein